MAFAQLYYTSCESGLSEFAGFQFNAATPGVSRQVLREVEALTSYEPPRSLGPRPGPAEIAGCPVNLVYRCEPIAVLAHVVFTGLDFSQRLGNYFAHALVAASDPENNDEAKLFENALPIELWASPLWARAPISSGVLPELPDLHPGPALTRAGIDLFLSTTTTTGTGTGEQTRAALATLLVAAEDAVLRRGRSIVLIDPDTTVAATWIAAISFLLPIEVARRMSFATYRHRPGYADPHVVATLPESDFAVDGAGAHGYVVFEPGSDRSDLAAVGQEGAAAAAAALLVRAGAVRADGLWQRAAELAGPGLGLGPRTLADNHPGLAAAAVLTGVPVTVTDLRALAEWLGSPSAPASVTGSKVLLERLLAELVPVARTDPDRAVDILAAGPERLIGTGHDVPTQLFRALLLARCRRDRDSRMVDLIRFTPAGQVPDEALLCQLWPERTWTPTEALAWLDSCNLSDLSDLEGGGPVVQWLARAVTEPVRAGDYLASYLSLCHRLRGRAGSRPWPVTAETAIETFQVAHQLLQRARTESAAAQAATLRTLFGPGAPPGPVQDLLVGELPARFAALAGSGQLGELVADCPVAVTHRYLALAPERLHPGDLDHVVALVRTLLDLRAGQDRRLAPGLDRVLRQGLRRWPSQRLDDLAARLLESGPEPVAGFAEWRRWKLAGARFRRFLRPPGRPAPIPPGRPTPGRPAPVPREQDDSAGFRADRSTGDSTGTVD